MPILLEYWPLEYAQGGDGDPDGAYYNQEHWSRSHLACADAAKAADGVAVGTGGCPQGDKSPLQRGLHLILALLIDVVAYDVVGREDGHLGNWKRAQGKQKTCACSWAEGSRWR